LARNMRAHNMRVQELMALDLHVERARHDHGGPGGPLFESFALLLGAMKKHAEAGRSVQESEERIIEGCKTLLDRLS
jgi:hypothetical protein